jgi:hypothetical protein
MAHPYPPPPPPPRRGGGGKALPVAVGAGLAVGVFLGLILIRGTDPAGAEDGLAGVDAGVAASMDAAVATAKRPDAAPAPVPIDASPEPRKAVLTFDVSPGSIDGIKLTVDGQEVSGDRFEIELGDEQRREVEIGASAPRYRRFRDKVEVSADRTVEIKMRRRGGGRPSGGSTTRPGGIIDL